MYLGFEDFAAYFYLAFGCISILYALGVKKAREKHRNYPLVTDDQQTQAEPEAKPESEVRELS
jgi:hypothetical protein